MDRRRVLAVGVAIAAGAITVTLLTPGAAVGKQSGPCEERIEICHQGKTIKIDASELGDHLVHGDTVGRCPKR